MSRASKLHDYFFKLSTPSRTSWVFAFFLVLMSQCPVGDPELLSKLRAFLYSQYPVDVFAVLKSLPHQALEALHGFFQGVSPPRELDGQGFQDHVTKASHVTRVLRALGCMSFEMISTDPSITRDGGIKKGKKSQIQKKRDTKLSISENGVDIEVFRALNLRVPSSGIGAPQIANDLLGIHKEVLTVRKPSFPVTTSIRTHVSYSTSFISWNFRAFVLLSWNWFCALLKPL